MSDLIQTAAPAKATALSRAVALSQATKSATAFKKEVSHHHWNPPSALARNIVSFPPSQRGTDFSSSSSSVPMSRSHPRAVWGTGLKNVDFGPTFLKPSRHNDGLAPPAEIRSFDDSDDEQTHNDATAFSQHSSSMMTPGSRPISAPFREKREHTKSFHPPCSPNMNNTNTSPTKTPSSSSPQSHTWHSPKAKRRPLRHGGGPLLSKLRSIRGSVEADWVRLQSGTYPFFFDRGEGKEQSKPNPQRGRVRRRRDLNDPRNKADSFVDVTILGQHPFPWLGGSDRTAVFGYVHCWSRTDRREMRCLVKRAGVVDSASLTPMTQRPRIANDDLVAKSDGDFPFSWSCLVGDVGSQANSGDLGSLIPCFAWICLSSDTVREEKVGEGIQLRIYDAIVVPPKRPPEGTGLTFPLVLCSRLCESYPTELPPLSAIPATPARWAGDARQLGG